MFFVLSNYKKKAPLTVTRSNDLYIVEARQDNLLFSATEDNSPVQFFCAKKSADGSFLKETIQPAKYFTVETLFEKAMVEDTEIGNEYRKLINDFGDKKTKDRLAKRGMISYAQKDPISFNIENQLLPDFDKDALSPTEAYTIDRLFTPETLEGFQAQKSYSDLGSFARKLHETRSLVPKFKTHLFAIDCICRTLEERFISDRTLDHYRFFYKEIEGNLTRGKLTPLASDQLAVKLYILILIVSDFVIYIDKIPKFYYSREKIQALLKMIGCKVEKDGKATLESSPKDTFVSKRLKR